MVIWQFYYVYLVIFVYLDLYQRTLEVLNKCSCTKTLEFWLPRHTWKKKGGSARWGLRKAPKISTILYNLGGWGKNFSYSHKSGTIPDCLTGLLRLPKGEWSHKFNIFPACSAEKKLSQLYDAFNDFPRRVKSKDLDFPRIVKSSCGDVFDDFTQQFNAFNDFPAKWVKSSARSSQSLSLTGPSRRKPTTPAC